MKVEKLPSGSYRVRKMYKGTTYSLVFDTKPSQKEIVEALAAAMQNTTSPSAKSRMTFKTAAKKYIQLKKNIISPSTIREYTGTIQRLSDHFNQMPVSEITAIDVQEEINNLAIGRSPKTIRNYHGFISAVLNTYNPKLILNTTLPPKNKHTPYIPTDQDVHKLLMYAKGSMFEIAIVLACFGLRRSEICALTLDDIEGNYIHINKALVLNQEHKWVIKSTKTPESTRSIWVPDEVIALIHSRKKIYSGWPGSITHYMEKAQDDLGIPRFSIHKLRHYFASVSHTLGIPDSYIMSSGGWKSPNVLTNVYRHALRDKTQEMQKISGEHLKNIVFKP